MSLFEGKNFRPLVFRRSPLFAAFTKAEAVKRKAQAKNDSPDSQEPTFTFLVAAEQSEAALGLFVFISPWDGKATWFLIAYFSGASMRSFGTLGTATAKIAPPIWPGKRYNMIFTLEDFLILSL